MLPLFVFSCLFNPAHRVHPIHQRRPTMFHSSISSRYHRVWHPVDEEMVPIIMEQFFSVHANKTQLCELFLIEGVPVASMLYTKTTANDMPVVDSFHINKALLILFDVAHDMRSKLFNRYDHLACKHAKNRDEFFSVL